MTNTVKLKDLTGAISEASGGAYHSYEVLDILELFTDVVEALVQQGKTVDIYNFGRFSPKINKPKTIIGFDGKPKITQETCTMGFRVSESMQNRVRNSYLEKKKKENN